MKVSMVINNSLSKISGLDSIQFKNLKKILSYTIDSTYIKNFKWKQVKYLIDRHGNFPTGLLPRVEKWLFSKSIKSTTYDMRLLPKSILSSLKIRGAPVAYPDQIEAINASQRKKRGIIVAPTGSGKSLMIAMLVEALNVRTLIVVPTLELKRQLTASFEQWFGTGVAGEWTGQLPVVIENVDALDVSKPVKGYDCVIIDEFHRSASNTYQKLNRNTWKDIYYRFGFTATPFRNKNDENLLLEAVISEVAYKIEYKTAVEKGYIVPMEAFVVECSKKNTTGHNYSSVYADLVVNNEERNTTIAQMVCNLIKLNTSVLVLVKEIKHGHNIQIECSKLGFFVEFAHGENKNSAALIDRFNVETEKALIGTTGVLGEGVDTRPAEYIIIAGLGKSKPAFMQQCGRGFRKFNEKKSCKVIIFKYTGHRWTKAHYAAQVKHLREEYGVEPIIL